MQKPRVSNGLQRKTRKQVSPKTEQEGLHEDPDDSRINGLVEGVSSHGQERAYEQNPGGPSRAAQQPLLRDLLSSDRKQSQQHAGTQRLLWPPPPSQVGA